LPGPFKILLLYICFLFVTFRLILSAKRIPNFLIVYVPFVVELKREEKQGKVAKRQSKDKESLRHIVVLVVHIAAGASLPLVVVFVAHIAAAGSKLAIPSIVATNFLLKTQPTEIASKFEEQC
jgi:hypothetical protein